MSWYQTWEFRKEITASRAAGAVTDYQLKIAVGESAGATGADVHCGGNGLSTFADLRFTNEVGTALPYWIESISGTTPDQIANVWVKFDSVLTTATTFYMYYGNATATSESRGADVFVVFDDFDGHGISGAPIGGIWDLIKAAEVSDITPDGAYADYISSHSCELPAGSWSLETNNNHISTDDLPTNEIVSVRALVKNYHADLSPYIEVAFGNGTKVAQFEIRWDNHTIRTVESVEYVEDEDDGDWVRANYTDTGTYAPSTNVWYEVELRNVDFASGTYDLYYTDASATWTLAKAAVPMYMAESLPVLYGSEITGFNGRFSMYHTMGTATEKPIYIDNVIVRKSRSSEPSISAFGAEETFQITLDTDISALRFSSYGAYAYTGDVVGWGALPTLTMTGQSGQFLMEMDGTLPALESEGHTGASLDADLLNIECDATMDSDGSIRTGDYFNDYTINLPTLEVEGDFGHHATLDAKLPDLEGTGRTGSYTDENLPELEITATCLVGQVATLDKKLPFPTLTASTGARLSKKLPLITINAEASTPTKLRLNKVLPTVGIEAAITGATGSLDKIIAFPKITATGSQDVTGNLDAKIPTLKISADALSGSTCTLDATLPDLRIEAESNSAVIFLDAYLPTVTTGVASGSDYGSASNTISGDRFDGTLLRHERWA